jgi:hypothetical protein
MLRISILIIFSLALIRLLSCGQGSDSTGENGGELKYLQTVYGGCNATFNRSEIPDTDDQQSDTVYYSVQDDILTITIGLNYICCAPFTLFQRQENQNLFITLYDSCGQTSEPCYCRCMCYYDFETSFSGYHQDTYNLKVFLHDPRQPADSLIFDLRIQ